MRIFFSCWLDIHTRNLIGSGLLARTAESFRRVFLALPTHSTTPISPPNVTLVSSRPLYAGRLFLWLAEFHKVHWILRNNLSETWARQIRERHGRVFFFFANRQWIILPAFFALAWLRLLITLPLLWLNRADLYVTSTFVWGPYDVVLALFAKFTRKPWIGLVTGWDNPSTKGRFILEPNLVIVWGEQQVEHAEKYLGIDRRKVIALAPPQFHYLLKVRDSPPASPAPRLTYIGVGPLNYPYEEEFVQSTTKAMDEIPEMQGWAMRVRPHPNDPGSWYRKFADGKTPRVELDPIALSRTSAWTVFGVDAEGLETYFRGLRDSKAVIAHYSTAVLEAGLLGVPSIVPRIDFKLGGDFQTRFDKFVHLEEIRRSPGLLTVSSEADLVSALRKITRGLTKEELAEHLRICHRIARVDGIKDLLGEYDRVFREFCAQAKGRSSQL